MPMSPELRRGAVLAAVSLTAAALCAGCGEVRAQTGLGPPRPVSVAIAGPPSALYDALYTAQADGDFHLGALAVTIKRAQSPLGALESGSAVVAIASEPALLAARAHGARLVAIGALVRQPLDGIVSLAARPIRSPAALAGASIGLIPTDPLAQAELRTMLATAQLTPASVHLVTGSLEPALSRQPAVQGVLADQWPIFLAALTLAHHPATVLEVQQAGVPTYTALAIVVRVGEARYDGPLLRAFLQSLTRGERAVAADPRAAAALLAKINPGLSAALERAVLSQTLPIMAPSGSSLPFGYQSPAAWQTFGYWMAAHGLLAPAPDAALAITDEFLPGQGA